MNLRARRTSRSAAALFLALNVLLLGGLLAALPGCGGCRKKPRKTQAEIDAEKKKKEAEEKKKPKEDYEFAKLQTLPGDTTYAVKPGHWMAVSQQMKANNFNFNGELMSAAVDRENRALALERTMYRLEMQRPASLPKGQAKHMEMTVFVPRRQGEARRGPTSWRGSWPAAERGASGLGRIKSARRRRWTTISITWWVSCGGPRPMDI